MKLLKLLNVITLAIVSISSVVAEEISIPLSNNSYHVYNVTSANNVQDIAVSIANADQVIIDVVSAEAATTVEILNPAGTAHTPDELNAYFIDVNQSPPLGSLFFEPGHHVQMVIKNPVAGQWTLRLSLPLGSTDLVGNVSIVRQGGAAMNVFTSRQLFNQGQDVVIASALFDNNVAITNAAVTAEVVEKADLSNIYTVNLHDSGSDPDSVSGDGLYTGSINSLQAGEYLITAKALVNGSQIEAVSEFRIVEPLGRINELVSNNGVDTNGDGLFEFISLNVELEIFQSGNYELQGIIQRDDNSINAINNEDLSAGIHVVSLLFAADEIRSFLKKDGPYTITELMLVKRSNSNSSGVLVDQHKNLGQTDAYLLQDLQRPPVQILSGIEVVTSDNDNNGLIDVLTTSFKVDLLISSNFTWSGSLQTGSGVVLGVASGRSYLSSGQHTLSFNFAGINIGESGIDGPYELRNVAIYGGGEAAVSDVVGLTSAYRYTEFEGSEASFDSLRSKIQSLIITGRGGVPRSEGIRVSLLAKLDTAESKAVSGQVKTAQNALNALSNEINAQSGKHISPSDAAELLALIQKISF